MRNELRLRVTDATRPQSRRIEVLDEDGNALGDLGGSVLEVRWLARGSELGIVSIDLACESAEIESIDVPRPGRNIQSV